MLTMGQLLGSIHQLIMDVAIARHKVEEKYCVDQFEALDIALDTLKMVETKLEAMED